MAVFIKYACVSFPLMFLSLGSLAQVTAITDPKSDLKQLGYWKIHDQPELKRCPTLYCHTLYNVSYAWDLLFHRDTPNTMARLKPYPDSFFTNSGLHAARLVVTLPDPAMTCFVEQKVIRELPVRFNDHLSFVELMELVSELPSGWEQCRQGIVSAMPQTPKTAEWLKDADEFIDKDFQDFPTLRKYIHRSAPNPHS